MMATKDQERSALEKIRKIVEGLGEESYIGRAFEGCFEMAQNNIDSDYWDSMKVQRDINQAEAEKWMDQVERITITKAAEIKTLLKQIEDYKEQLNAMEQEANQAKERVAKLVIEKAEIGDEIQKKDTALAKANDLYEEMYEKARGYVRKLEDLKWEVEQKDLEIMKLKAKLYDAMIGTE